MYIILSFCFGLFLGYLLFNKHCKENNIVVVPKIETAKKELQVIVTDKLIYELRFKNVKDSLTKKLSIQNSLLASQKKALVQSQEHLKQLVFQLKTDSFANRDTVLIDSLSFEIQASQIKTDTIIETFERKLKLYNAMVAVRDSELVSVNKSFHTLANFSKEQLAREQQLTIDLNTALKSLRKKRIQNKIWAGGMLFISGVATTLLIKSRQ